MVSAEGIAHAEVQIVEVHVIRAEDIVIRGRPVVAVAAHIADRSPPAVACGRQEDCTMRLKGICPSGRTNHIATEAREYVVCAV